MSTEQPRSPLQFFAELGDLIARYAQNRDFAIGMVVISVILWPIGALIASLLIAKIYVQSRLAPTQTPPTPTASRSEDFEDWLILGVFLIGVGVYFWVKDYLPEPPWSVVLIVVGALLVGLAYARRGGGPSA
jgi:uncharacterized paraquat-inducible protein A